MWEIKAGALAVMFLYLILSLMENKLLCFFGGTSVFLWLLSETIKDWKIKK